MSSSPTPMRWPALTGTALLALALGACQPAEPVSDRARIQSLLPALERAQLIPGDRWARSTERVLIDLQSHPFVSLTTPQDPADVPVRPRLEFGQGLLSMAASAPVEPDDVGLLAELEWSYDLEVPSGALQTEWVFLDRAVDWSDPLASLEHVVHRELTSVPIDPTGRATFTLAQRVPEGARHVLLAVTRALEGPGRARVVRAKVSTCSFAGLVELAREPGSGRLIANGEDLNVDGVERGWFQSQMVYRPGAALQPGGGLRLPAPLPQRPGAFEAEVGLLAHLLADTETEVVFEASFAEEEPRELARLRLDDPTEGRWKKVRLPWPEDYAGELVGLEIVARVEGSGFTLPVLGAPSLVPDDPHRDGPDLLLFSLDTLRADHLGCYGYERDTSPNVDALAERGLRFTDVWSESAYTLPTHTTIFTGQHSAVHGVTNPGDVLDRLRSPLLAPRLLREGRATAAFTGGGFLLPKFGLHEGFERYGVVDVQWNRESQRLRDIIGRLEGLTREAAEAAHPERIERWIEDHAHLPSFLFVHTYAPHEFDAPSIDRRALGLEGPPLEDDPVALAWIGSWRTRPEAPISDVDRRRMIDLYDAAVHQADRLVGSVLDAVERTGQTAETVVVLTSDHGKELGERGIIEHGHSLQEELLDVPLILAGPGVPQGVRDDPAMQVDLVPTLWSLLGMAPEHPVQGRDLLAPIEGGPRPMLAELDWRHTRLAFREGPRKWLAQATQPERDWDVAHVASEFDLGVDPGERAPLPVDPEREARAFAAHAALRALGASLASGEGESRSIDAATAKTLQALGYTVE